MQSSNPQSVFIFSDYQQYQDMSFSLHLLLIYTFSGRKNADPGLQRGPGPGWAAAGTDGVRSSALRRGPQHKTPGHLRTERNDLWWVVQPCLFEVLNPVVFLRAPSLIDSSNMETWLPGFVKNTFGSFSN